MKTCLERLFRHLQWADDQVLRTAEAAGTFPQEALRLLAHILGAEQVWLARIQGRETVPVWPQLAVAECRALSGRNLEGYREVLAATAEEGFEAVVDYRDTRGTAHRTRLGDILLHVALHGAHHRGQIAALVRAAGLQPAGTDYILFCRSGLADGRP